MSTSTPTSNVIAFLHSSFPSAIPSDASESDLASASHQIYPNTSYTDNEKVEVSQWLTTSSHLAVSDEDEAKHAERLGSLNIHLSTRTTLLGTKPSIADPVLFYRLSPAVKRWSVEERTGEKGYPHIVRYIDFVQNGLLFGLSIPESDKVAINPDDIRFVHKPVDPKEEKERRKKEKAATAATSEGQSPLVVGRGKNKPNCEAAAKTEDPSTEAKAPPADRPQQSKKEKKEKTPKPAKQATAPKETLLSPSLIDLRVAHILKAENHPNADTLYVSTVACGDPPGTENTSTYESQTVRTVCSGLNGQIPLSEMQNRKIVAVCNLKPVTMRGVKSCAMVLAASPRVKEGEDEHGGPVELVEPPKGAQPGDRVWFEGWEGEPEGQLNPKKKIWESLQPGFGTSEGLDVAFDAGPVEPLREKCEGKGVGRLVTKGGGVCKIRSLKGATVR